MRDLRPEINPPYHLKTKLNPPAETTMVHYRRNFVEGGTYFFTVTLQNRRATTLTTYIDVLRKAFRTARAERAFQTDAIVILPDHLHMLMTLPPDDENYPRRWQRIKTLFTQALRREDLPIDVRDKTGRALWQRRYWEHTIRDATDFASHVDYIHYNPVRHGYTARAVDWPYSSLHRYIRAGVLPADWATDSSFSPSQFGEQATE